MKKNILVIILISFFCKINAQINKKYINREADFEPNEIAYLFGNDVKLRVSPNTESNIIQLLKITSEIKILEKTSENYFYNGIDWPWYKVQYEDKTGYIIGGLISLDKKSIDTTSYLVSFKKENDHYKILTRVVNQHKDYLENSEDFGTEHYFTMEVFDNKGINEIKNIVLIDYHAEACGVEGGGYYLFYDGLSLIKAIDYSEVADGGVYWFFEEFIFPNDKKGKKGKILYKKETGTVIDEVTDREKVIIETCEFTWQGKLLKLKDIEE